ncbi:MAG: vanadium-dependent haloperoxidase [Flavobacteriaceae bacterium]|nr:vanadium-dependent haloperoxidase [Bacteroidia bacterium]NNF75970.1 vanadium-dependent haloperoxidase [Flavobacteriaceae bacterium]NNK72263.1 vanadium-dependent haloperoxidase [Flavobacteriaceae bacterium]
MRIIVACLLLVFAFSCKQAEPIQINRADFFGSVDKVTEIMVHDIFSPPVASRIYVYPNIAAYEIIAVNSEEFNTLSGQIPTLPSIEPAKDLNINLRLAALIAHMDVSRKLIFSEEKIAEYRDALYKQWGDMNSDEFEASKTYGLAVSEKISQWYDGDNYKETRTMPKFTVNTDEVYRWQPTPPAYMDGIEPAWNKIRPMVLDSADQFIPVPHPEFSMDPSSNFYKELIEVYDVSNKITAEGDDSEEIEIAQFWDCNPYVSVTRGHLMFATKKITPGAHWIGISKIACNKSDYNFEDTVFAMTKSSIAIFDAFISCWDEKYRSNLVRPETLINNYIDDQWEPILQTPPFPEYPSGHSVVSGAASVVLTSIFGDNFSYDDDTEQPYGLPIRSFPSFIDAAKEAAISRMYGGIHYMAAIDNGVDQGFKIGELVASSIKMKN